MIRKQKPIRWILCLEALEDRFCPSSMALDTPLTQPDVAAQMRVSQAYGQLPLTFESNQGQTDAQVNFLSRGNGYSLFLSPNQAVLDLQQGTGNDAVLRMQLVGANPTARALGIDPLPGKVNYLIGNDPAQWHTDVPTYAKLGYQNVYPGVDLVYYGNQRQLEYDFVVAPGADPHAVTLSFEGTAATTLDAHGNLVLHTAGGDVVEHAPVLYQTINGVRRDIEGRYVLLPTADSESPTRQVGFQVGGYDTSQALVIDPVLSYSTYLGGGSSDAGFGIAVDASGSAYITGRTWSADFPTMNPLQPHMGSKTGVQTAFVTRLNATGSGLVYSTYLGGSDGDEGDAIAVDSAGNAYVAGWTLSNDFPTKNAFQAKRAGDYDAFVAKLNPSGSALLYSSFLGGSGRENANLLLAKGGIAVDGAGNAYVTGTTTSTNFPTVHAFQPANHSPGTTDAFITKVNTTLAGTASLVYSTYLGGKGHDEANAIAVDAAGAVFVAGMAISPDFPTTPGAFQTTATTSGAAFVAKLSADGSALVYSTYLGGPGADGTGIAVDGSGNAYVTGRINKIGIAFPTTDGAFQTTGPASTFVTKLNASGSGLVYSTYLGVTNFSSSAPSFNRIAVDSSGDAYVVGSVNAPNPFPTTPDSLPYGGVGDAVVAKLNATGSGLLYSTYLGGSNGDAGLGIAVDGSGNAYVTGWTYSTNFPTVNPFQANNRGGTDAFVTKISSGAALMAAMSAPTSMMPPALGGDDPAGFTPACFPGRSGRRFRRSASNLAIG